MARQLAQAEPAGQEAAAAPAPPPAGRAWTGYLLLSPALLAMGIFLVALAFLFQYSVREFIPGSLRVGGYTLANFRQIVGGQYLRAVTDTFLLSLYTTVFTLVLSYPVAYALARSRRAWLRSALMILTIAPFFTGAIVRSYAWMLVLGNSGFVNSMLRKIGLVESPIQMLFTPFGVTVGLVHFSMPVMILILAAAISHIDADLERSADSLGASPVQTFLRVTLPLSMPGIISGTVVIFAWTFSAFPTPELLGGGKVKMIANVVKDLILDSFNWPGGAAFAFFALGVTFLLVLGVARLAQRQAGGAAYGRR